MESILDLVEWTNAALGLINVCILIVCVKAMRMTKDLHVWHSKEDDDGVKVWYVRKSLENAVTKLADNIEAQTTLLTRLVDSMERLDRDVRSD